MQYNHNSRHVRETVLPFVCTGAGEPVTFDAAQVGSYAHRLRSSWTNPAPTPALKLLSPGLLCHCDEFRRFGIQEGCRGQLREMISGFFQANVTGYDRAALPTLMAHPNSYAFRDEARGQFMISTCRRFVSQPRRNESLRWVIRRGALQPPRFDHNIVAQLWDGLWTHMQCRPC